MPHEVLLKRCSAHRRVSISDGQGIQASFAELKKAFTRRAIDQLGYIKDVNSLVVLSGKLNGTGSTDRVSQSTDLGA